MTPTRPISFSSVPIPSFPRLSPPIRPVSLSSIPTPSFPVSGPPIYQAGPQVNLSSDPYIRSVPLSSVPSRIGYFQAKIPTDSIKTKRKDDSTDDISYIDLSMLKYTKKNRTMTTIYGKQLSVYDKTHALCYKSNDNYLRLHYFKYCFIDSLWRGTHTYGIKNVWLVVWFHKSSKKK